MCPSKAETFAFHCLKRNNQPILQKRKLDKQEKWGKILCPFQDPLKSSAVAEYESCSFPSWMILIILTVALWELTFTEACVSQWMTYQN